MNELIRIEDKTVFDMTADFTAAEEWAKGLCAKYQGLVIAEDDVVSIKKEMAELNKYAKDIDDSRKAIEKKYKELIAPYIDKIKDVKSIFDETYSFLSRQVKAYEAEDLKKRKEAVETLIEKVIVENGMEKYRDDFSVREKWLKKSTTDKSILSELSEIVERTRERIAGEAERVRLEQERIDAITQEAERLKEEYPETSTVLSVWLTSNKPLNVILHNMRESAKERSVLIQKGLIRKAETVEEQKQTDVSENVSNSTPLETTRETHAEDASKYLFRIEALVVGHENALRVKELFAQVKEIAETFKNID